MWQSVENKRTAHADDATLLGVVPSPQLKTEVAGALNRDLGQV